MIWVISTKDSFDLLLKIIPWGYAQYTKTHPMTGVFVLKTEILAYFLNFSSYSAMAFFMISSASFLP